MGLQIYDVKTSVVEEVTNLQKYSRTMENIKKFIKNNI